MEASIRAKAENVVIPDGTNLEDPKLAERAIGHYSVACAQRHGAPGHPAAPWMVLYPAPADLTRSQVVSRWSDAELYWIVKHGGVCRLLQHDLCVMARCPVRGARPRRL
jgi:hypothetical protein